MSSNGFASRYSYMIDNVILLITGTLHDRDVHEVCYKALLAYHYSNS